MRTDHLTHDELEALACGEETDSSVDMHLRRCAECREAAREAEFGTRYLRPLAGDHPDESLLTALWSHAVTPSREKELGSHVADYSRCRALLARPERVTPSRAHPHRVSDAEMAQTSAWAVASTGPRRATLFFGMIEGLDRLRASVESTAEALRIGMLRPSPSSVARIFLDSPEFDGSAARARKYEAEGPEDRRASPRAEAPSPDKSQALEPPVVNDGRHAFRFETKREGATTRLVVGYVARSRPAKTTVKVVLDVPGLATQRAELALGGEAVFEISPGHSQLAIEVTPAWEIEIHVEA